ncbi:MAG TPA: hypothetical protein VL968_08065 [Rhodocyclaceae bacterium]|jgi:hypothetical protein|nr:hypothetical protein [Rhodocyclaceae bacterium]
MKLDHSLVFFDIDSLECRPDAVERASILPRLAFRERVMPIVEKLDWLYEYSLAGRHPLLFSVCCSGRLPTEGEIPDMLSIPAEAGEAWLPRVADHQLFLVEKARRGAGGATGDTTGTIASPARGAAFVDDMHDKFRLNTNLEKFIDLLAPEEWVVFGNGAAFCVHPVLSILMDAGQKVTILSDVMVDSAGGYASETPESLRLAMLDDMAARGARVCRFEEFQARLDWPGAIRTQARA